MIESVERDIVEPGLDDELALVERARTGDADAFDALVTLRLMPTFRLARAILGVTEEAEDATQEAFVAAWRGLRSLRDPGRFDAWFGRIVVNACRMTIRRRSRDSVTSIESMAHQQQPVGEDVSLNGLDDTDLLHRAIDLLDVRHRAILALYYLEDRPVADVAARLGITTGTAKWRLFEARAALREAMASDDHAPVFRPAFQPASIDQHVESGA